VLAGCFVSACLVNMAARCPVSAAPLCILWLGRHSYRTAAQRTAFPTHSCASWSRRWSPPRRCCPREPSSLAMPAAGLRAGTVLELGSLAAADGAPLVLSSRSAARWSAFTAAPARRRRLGFNLLGEYAGPQDAKGTAAEALVVRRVELLQARPSAAPAPPCCAFRPRVPRV
jgi:hypothetical protein